MKKKTLKEKWIDTFSVIIMVFIMVIYNSLWKEKMTLKSIKGLCVIYPIILGTVLILRTFVSAPVARNIHKRVKLLRPDKFHITIPAMIINLNSLIVVGLSTYFLHNYQSGHFFEDYLINFIRSFLFALLAFFFLVSPLIRKIKKWLKIQL